MAAHQAPPSLGFSRQEYWSGLPFLSPMHESEKWIDCLKYTKNEQLLNKTAKEENPAHILNHFVMVDSWRKDKSYRTKTNARGRNSQDLKKKKKSFWLSFADTLKTLHILFYFLKKYCLNSFRKWQRTLKLILQYG